MPTLIAQRPHTWNEVVGQPRAIEVLQAALRNQRFLSRGIILHGVVGVGKLLDVNELIPTPNGFVRNGDIQDGDHVLGEHGNQITVLKAHPSVQEKAFKITFDDGTFTYAHAGHLWHTYTLNERGALSRSNPEWRASRRRNRLTKTDKRWSSERLKCSLPKGGVRTTEEIMNTLRAGTHSQINHAVPLADSVVLPEVDLPIDPYTLGAWLGDGHSSGSGFTGLPEDAEEILKHFSFPYRKAKGNPNGWIIGDGNFVRLGKFKCRTNPFTAALKLVGVLHKKHIPHEYLWASKTQRLALLQGLMDTDGSCTRSLCEFSNMNRGLAEGVYHLAASLGLKPFWGEGQAKLNGKDCGTKYRVTWTGTTLVFRLPRKLARLPKVVRSTQNWRYIVSVEPAKNMRMRCLTVDNPSGLYLFGKNFNVTHNTTSAYLAAKALMCTGDENLLGCGQCPSCQLVQKDGIDSHPDFIEIDGAVKPGVEGARDTLERTLTLPVLGKRRVTIIDEAHWLSAEAWSAYLKTLEDGETNSIFLFVSQDYGKIQNNIRTRCIRIAFERVSQDVLVGHLANAAAKNDIGCDLDALKLIARSSKGIVRDAVQHLSTCGALGVRVTADVVRQVVDTSLDDLCEKLLQTVAAKDQVEAIRLADELVRRDMPGKAAERMLSLYSQAIYAQDPELRKIYLGLPDVSTVAGVLAKWAAVQHAPADIITIVVYELLKTQSAVRALPVASPRLNPQPTHQAAPTRQKSPLEALLDGEAV